MKTLEYSLLLGLLLIAGLVFGTELVDAYDGILNHNMSLIDRALN